MNFQAPERASPARLQLVPQKSNFLMDIDVTLAEDSEIGDWAFSAAKGSRLEIGRVRIAVMEIVVPEWRSRRRRFLRERERKQRRLRFVPQDIKKKVVKKGVVARGLDRSHRGTVLLSTVVLKQGER